ncbi:hypothetical protein DL346_25805 [Paenibacillus montanisoli]|uniref:Uncharacterized protein n=2 Tax=Paenibacillus montanisoli TaxID=2081970 RepID=A0A328U107_9BACL|nr:hypothetical protein DL346_25805 [Paenibacillus montanisoli]
MGGPSKYNNTFDTKALSDIIILAGKLKAFDCFTWTHSINVANYAYTLANIFDLSSEELNNVYIGALLHDIGKTQIPEVLLKKTSKLTSSEWKIMKTHPRAGVDLLRHSNHLMKSKISDIILHHHERFDGKGYPDSLAGDEIPLAAKIVTVADSFDAMTSKRHYRNPLDKKTAANQILTNAGRQFDPQIALRFVEFIMTDEKLHSPPNQLKKLSGI